MTEDTRPRSLLRRITRTLLLLAAVPVGLFVLALGFGAVRALTATSVQLAVAPDATVVDADAAAQRLAKSLTFVTVSGTSPATFSALFDQLEVDFAPCIASATTRERYGEERDRALVLTFKGAQPGPGTLLYAHVDVVPADPAGWTQAPFGGDVAGGFVWGRGALDDKARVLAMLEACMLMAADPARTVAVIDPGAPRKFAPQHDITLVFGTDEEIGGASAQLVRDVLKEQGARFAMVLDEGSPIVTDAFPGLEVATIGVAEKGYVTATLSVDAPGGHASIAGAETAPAILLRALARLDASPAPQRMTPLLASTLMTLAPELPFVARIGAYSPRLFRRTVLRALAAKPSTAALTRTTRALTVVRAGETENVIPSHAEAKVNLRVLPGESTADALALVTRTLADDRVHVTAGAIVAEPSAVSSSASDGYRAVASALRAVWPGVVVAPALIVPSTDSRHFAALTDDVYRVYPFRIAIADAARIHGVDERIAVDEYARAIRFYAHLLRSR